MAAHSEHKHAGPGRYVAVWVALLVFTAITVSVARIHLPGGWALAAALCIAAVKATLVALFFMHLWDHGGANRLVVGTSLVFVVLLLGLILVDNATRFPLANPPTDATVGLEPPGPDILSPRLPAGPPARH